MFKFPGQPRLSNGFLIAIIICLWVGLNPILRYWIYPRFDFKTFISVLDAFSALILILEVLCIVYLFGTPRRGWWQPRDYLRGFCLLPFFWLLIGVVLWVLLEFNILQESRFDPIYDSPLYAQRHIFSWTTLGFLASAFLEEAFFRAWLPDTLERRFRRSTALLLSAMAFTLAHLSYQSSSFALVAYFLVALGLSYVRIFHGVGAAMGLHLLNNLLVLGQQILGWNVFSFLSDAGGPWLYLALIPLLAGAAILLQDIKSLMDRGRQGP